MILNGTYRKTKEIYNGEIPDEYVIHHIDFNPANNALSNLQMMERGEHVRLHNFARQKRLFTCTYCGKIFYKYDNRPDTDNNFCSPHCDERWRSLKKLYQEERTCIICGINFEQENHRKQKPAHRIVMEYYQHKQERPATRIEQAADSNFAFAKHKCQRRRLDRRRCDDAPTRIRIRAQRQFAGTLSKSHGRRDK